MNKDEPKYATKFINKRPHSVEFKLSGGSRTIFQGLGEEVLYTNDSRSIWSRFKEVKFLKNGGISTMKNPDWKPYWDDKAWTTVFENRDGAPFESFYVSEGEEPITVPRGMSLTFPVSLWGAYVKYKKVVIVMETGMERVGRSGHYRRVRKIQRKQIERSASDLKKIEKEIEKMHEQKGKKASGAHAEALGITSHKRQLG